MTAIITVLTGYHLFQVADQRLTLSYASGRAHPEFDYHNKVVVYTRRDAVASIAASGLAVVAGVSVDELIASAISGRDVHDGELGPPPAQSPHKSLMHAVRSIVDRLTLHTAGHEQLLARTSLTVDIGGFAAAGHGWRPILWRISFQRGRFELADMLPGQDRMLHGQYTSLGNAAAASPQSVERVALALAEDPPDVAGVLALEIERLATVHATVGPFSTAVYIAPEAVLLGASEVDEVERFAFTVMSYGSELIEVSPWVVSAHGSMSPKVLKRRAGRVSDVLRRYDPRPSDPNLETAYALLDEAEFLVVPFARYRG